MNKSITMKKVLLYLYIIIEAIVITVDTICVFMNKQISFDYIRYGIIIFNFLMLLVFVLINKIPVKPFDNRLFLLLALFFTIVSDTGLIILSGLINELFIFTFALVQICYLFYISSKDRKTPLISLFILLVYSVITFTLYYIFKLDFRIDIMMCVIYGIIFIFNIVLSIIKKMGIFFIIGLSLYFMCDLCIMLANFTELPIFSSLVFAFYLSGQAFITYYAIKKVNQ